ncbi:MAG TPA: tetratricopeptide repeat protein [Pyrinomonadaceae bacterium]|nr:tetratricopeptide repeat protein [Pyrinomonadaceae bacterium]
MSRENILFSIAGLLFGYALAFTLVTYFNLHHAPPQTSQAAGATSGLPSGHPDVPDEVTRASIQQAEAEARRKPQDFDAQMNAAIAFARADDNESAIEYLTKARAIDPDSYDTLIGLGTVNYNAGKWNEAERWYLEALKRKPEDVDARTFLGLTYSMRQPSDYERAIAEYRKALETEPTHEPALQNLATAYVRKGQLTEAAATIETLERANPNNSSLPTLRKELEQARQKPSARKASEPAKKGKK